MVQSIADTVDKTKAKFLSEWDGVVTDLMAKNEGV